MRYARVRIVLPDACNPFRRASQFPLHVSSASRSSHGPNDGRYRSGRNHRSSVFCRCASRACPGRIVRRRDGSTVRDRFHVEGVRRLVQVPSSACIPWSASQGLEVGVSSCVPSWLVERGNGLERELLERGVKLLIRMMANLFGAGTDTFQHPFTKDGSSEQICGLRMARPMSS